MKKVIIISYFFPPCNLTASNRSYGWALNLYKFGYYPIFITRNWDIEINSLKDISKKSGEKVKIIKKEKFEVHYLPYEQNLRDRLIQKKLFIYIPIVKLLTFTELIFQNFTISAIVHKNIYFYTCHFLSLNKDISKMIITANPFNLFYFGYKLNKKHKIKWIADYRDDWTTSDLKENNKSIIFRLIKKLERKSEKKWVKSSSLIMSVSDHYQKKISFLVGVKGKELINGYNKLENNSFKLENKTEFQITYNGTLYDSQKIEIFIFAIIDLIKSNKKIKIYFPGLAYTKTQEKRIRNLIKGYESYFIILKRISKPKVISIQKQSHLLLMVGHEKIKGIPSSKIYEYISLQKPILLVNPDGDILEKTVKKCGFGYIANSKKEIFKIIEKMYIKFERKEQILNRNKKTNISLFSREKSTKLLSSYLDELN